MNQWNFMDRKAGANHWLTGWVSSPVSEFSALKISPFQSFLLFEEQKRNDCSLFLYTRFLPVRWHLALIQS